MLRNAKALFERLVVVALIAGCVAGPNPWACSIALLVGAAWSIADQYFDGSVFKGHLADIQSIRTDLEKIKSKQNITDLKSALGGQRNG